MTHVIHEYNHGGVCIFCGYEKKAMAESIQDQKECKVKADSLNNSDKDVKSDETKNSDGNESKSECCSPIITEADEIDAILANIEGLHIKEYFGVAPWMNNLTHDFSKNKYNIEAKANLLFLKERWEREAELDALEGDR